MSEWAAGWNFDMSLAPRGRYVKVPGTGPKGNPVERDKFEPDLIIAASQCGKVIQSYWAPRREWWAGFATGEQPVARMAWPEHPTIGRSVFG